MGNRARAKGSQGEKEVAELLLKRCNLKYAGKFTFRDFRTVASGANEEDVKFSTEAHRVLPIAVEVKFNKQATACRWMAQAESHADKMDDDVVPTLFFRQNHGKWYGTIDAELLIDLLLDKYYDKS